MILKRNQQQQKGITKDDIEHKQIDLDDQFRLYVENPPKWNDKHKKYTYNFNNRVTMASIKNF